MKKRSKKQMTLDWPFDKWRESVKGDGVWSDEARRAWYVATERAANIANHLDYPVSKKRLTRGATADAIRAKLHGDTDSRQMPGVAFSLVCGGCDAGGDIENLKQAIKAGWTGFTFDPFGLSWTWLGMCPDCEA